METDSSNSSADAEPGARRIGDDANPKNSAAHNEHVSRGVGDKSQDRSRKRLLGAVTVTATIMVAEIFGGTMSKSLALLADAGHMLIDLLSLVVALAVVIWGARPADARRTYGYRRLEVLGALANGLTLIGVAGSITYEAIERFRDATPVDLPIMIGVASLGLLANIAGLWFLGRDHDSVNIRGAFLHLMGDTVSSVGVIIGGIVIATTGWLWVDPLLSIGLALLITVSSYRLLKEVTDILLEAVPPKVDLEAVLMAMQQVQGVGNVHDLHIWSITSGTAALSAHLVVAREVDNSDGVLRHTLSMLRERFQIDHATLQIEHDSPSVCGCPAPHAAKSTPGPRPQKA